MDMKFRNPPVLLVQGRTITEVWELSVMKTWEEGIEVMTEYDKPGDLPSKDGTMIMVVEEPMEEPRIHLSIPCGLEDLEKYREEVISGYLDHFVLKGKVSYTYHERLFGYRADGEEIDQIDYIVERLSEVPYTRRAQAITWNPRLDLWKESPPCLQRLWGRCVRDGEGKLYLVMNSHWRSRDAYKAAFMNIYVLTDLQKMIAKRISEKMGEEVSLGRYTDITDSYHIYGKDHGDVEHRFIKNIEQRPFEDEKNPYSSRTIRSDHPVVIKAFERARRKIEEEKNRGSSRL